MTTVRYGWMEGRKEDEDEDEDEEEEVEEGKVR